MSRAKQKAGSRPRRRNKPVRKSANRADRSIDDYVAYVLAMYAAGMPLKIEQIALVTGLSRAQIYRLGEDGPPFFQVKRGVKASRRLYFAKDVEPWLRKHTINPMPVEA